MSAVGGGFFFSFAVCGYVYNHAQFTTKPGFFSPSLLLVVVCMRLLLIYEAYFSN